ncbi:phage terminase large subunit family protein (plasmid) [Entomospira entomophila]|uniref:Terminase n=1 Tax=Entomospira entomophila TaxID=2719988 RepID=A0A968KX58_9SPIO|nr:terminase gpA endonuclease subunit [Entomospira entomophilus]NIZ41520.1 hypothetical protein [Entomospira entomophilus]WDI36396.1 phage terminase large subunit family protein [Entomospira entomophilus]
MARAPSDVLEEVDYEQLFWQLMRGAAEKVLDAKSYGLKPSEWAEQKRVMSNVLSATPGHWDNNNTPYLTEIMDNFAPHSGCREFVVLKSTRMGFTTAMMNVFGWIIDQQPCATRLLIPNETTLKDIMNLQLDDLIITSGLANKIVATTNVKSKKKTGSSTFEKNFVNGHIIGASLNSKQALASYAAQVIVVDEFDEVLQGKEKSHEDIRTRVRDRASTYGRRARLAYMSMPSNKESSQVYKLFLDGDQRYYFVPCPYCGHYQRIQWQDEHGNFLFHYELDSEDRYVKGSAAMICQNEVCGKHIHENHKYEMLKAGQWRATAIAKDGALRSYQINGLYSNFRDWDDIVEQWILAQGDVSRLQSFVKSILGEPWEDRQFSGLWRRLRTVNRGENISQAFEFYWSDEQLASIKYITVGVDVQHNYLEGQIVGWASYGVGYDLHHFQVKSASLDLDEKEKGESSLSLAFAELRRMIVENDWNSPYLGKGHLAPILKRAIATKGVIRPHIILVDSGYKPDLVYNFCAYFKNRGVYASRGQNTLTSGQVIDAKPSEQAGTTIIKMNTDILKLEIDQAMRDSDFDKVAINIQRTRDEQYFKGLASERRVERNGKYYWEKNAGHKRNEVLDCWVMARGGLWFLASHLSAGRAINWDKIFK